MSRTIDDLSSLLRVAPAPRRRAFAILCSFVLVLVLVDALVLSMFVSGWHESVTGTLDAVLSRRVLRIGMTLDYPPFSLRCANGLSAAGADVEAALALAASLDAQLLIVPTSWPSLLDDAKKGTFDAAAGGISVTLRRLRTVSFSRATSHGGKVVVAPCGSRALDASATSPPSAQLVVAVNEGGTNELFVRSSWPNASVRFVPQGDQFAAMLRGEANLTVTDDAEAALVVARHARRLCHSALLTNASKAMMLPRQADVVWTGYVNQFVAERQASGSDAEAIERWTTRLAASDGVGEDTCEGAVRAPVT